MFYGKKVASRLKRQRILLQKQHKDILAVLNEASGQTTSKDVAKRIQYLRTACRAAMIDSIVITRTITRKMLVLNFGGIIDAYIADMHLSVAINDVLTTLNKLDPKNSGR